MRPIFSRLALLTAVATLCSCEGSNSRDIGGGYRLKRTGDPPQFALITPHESGGLIIDEIGWLKPVIIARASGSSYWDAIDTAHAQHIRISDEQRLRDTSYQSITIEKVEAAWGTLEGRGRLW